MDELDGEPHCQQHHGPQEEGPARQAKQAGEKDPPAVGVVIGRAALQLGLVLRFNPLAVVPPGPLAVEIGADLRRSNDPHLHFHLSPG